VLETGCLK